MRGDQRRTGRRQSICWSVHTLGLFAHARPILQLGNQNDLAVNDLLS
jgi:hypothetical protein